MQHTESLEEFYAKKRQLLPGGSGQEPGHFNVYKMGHWVGGHLIPTPFHRKAFYKIKLILGRSRCYFADKTIEITQNALLFASPLIPYQLEWLDEEPSEYACILTEGFFHAFGPIRQYPVFDPASHPVYFLSDAQVVQVLSIYQAMETELASGYAYKWDLLRNLVYELVHLVMKISPAPVVAAPATPANARIASLFQELLELQFPLEAPGAGIQLRKPQDFARQFGLHLNHLNRALKATLGKTTSQCISERLLREAKILLSHSDWDIAEIAYGLGFEEPAYFSSFFKKQVHKTPGQFRQEARWAKTGTEMS